MLKDIKLTYSDGSINSTSINGAYSDNEIRAYFLGKVFNVGVYPRETMAKCVKVEILKSEDKNADL